MALPHEKISSEEATIGLKPEVLDHTSDDDIGVVTERVEYDESRKLGITGSVFLILNKMIGTGIFSTPSSIFAATGSVGISIILWVIGKSGIYAGDINPE